jgi:hypothetical protein
MRISELRPRAQRQRRILRKKVDLAVAGVRVIESDEISWLGDDTHENFKFGVLHSLDP